MRARKHIGLIAELPFLYVQCNRSHSFRRRRRIPAKLSESERSRARTTPNLGALLSRAAAALLTVPSVCFLDPSGKSLNERYYSASLCRQAGVSFVEFQAASPAAKQHPHFQQVL